MISPLRRSLSRLIGRPRALAVLLAGFIVSALAIWWAVRQSDLGAFRLALDHFDAVWVIPLSLVYLSSFVLRGIRWQWMLAPVQRMGWGSSTAAIFVGSAANNLLPLRLGEIARAVALQKLESVPVGSGLSSVLLERVFDGLVLVGMLCIAGLLVAPGEAAAPVLLWAGAVGGTVFVAALAVLVLASTRAEWLWTVVRWALWWIPQRLHGRIEELFHAVVQGLVALSSRRVLARLVILTIGIWLVEAAVFWMALIAFGITTSFVAAVLILCLISMTIMLPSAPGYVGLFQGGAVLAFQVLGLPAGVALGYSVVVHLVHYTSTTVLGLVFATRLGLSLAKLEPQTETALAHSRERQDNTL